MNPQVQIVEGNTWGTVGPATAVIDGRTVEGLNYSCQGRYEEESGVKNLGWILRRGSSHLTSAHLKEHTGFVLSWDPVLTDSYDWNSSLGGVSDVRRGQVEYDHQLHARMHLGRHTSVTADDLSGTMDDLKRMSRDRWITPGSKRKDELKSAILWDQAALDAPEVWPAWFHTGLALAVRADSGPTAKLVRSIGQAAVTGRLNGFVWHGEYGTNLLLHEA